MTIVPGVHGLRFLLAALPLLSGALAQEPVLPRVPQLGAMPDAPRLRVAADGKVDTSALAGGADVVLWCDAAATCGAIATAIEKAKANGARVVFFAATQPDGQQGTLALALPAVAEPATTLTLRAHRERPGVPARSVVPLLTRMRKGWEHDGSRAFVLELDVPADATAQQLLSLFAAATESGVQSASLRIRTEDPRSRAGALALDLAGAVQAHVLAADPSVPPGRESRTQGMLRAPPPPTPHPEGHIGLACPEPPPGSFLPDTQRPDGSAGENDAADPEATSLAALATLGDGSTLDSGKWCLSLRRSVGWLLAQQRSDGSFESPSAGSLQRHAQITYALAEAAGLSTSGDLLRAAVGDALHWLVDKRRREGGWGPSCGAPPNANATAWAFLAIAAAAHHELARAVEPNDVVSWFDRFADESPANAGAEMLCRYLAGQEPKTTPRLARLESIVLDADMSDPQATFWASYALFQNGGTAWRTWSDRLAKRVVATLVFKEGGLRGSWHPTGDCSRTTTTAFNLLSLEAYYRYGKLLPAQ